MSILLYCNRTGRRRVARERQPANVQTVTDAMAACGPDPIQSELADAIVGGSPGAELVQLQNAGQFEDASDVEEGSAAVLAQEEGDEEEHDAGEESHAANAGGADVAPGRPSLLSSAR